MKTVGAYEAKTHLPRLLDEVAKGETVTITKHGHPVAKLVPTDDLEERRRIAREAGDAWTRYRKEHNIRLGPDMTLEELLREAKRHPSDEYWEARFDEMDKRDRERQET